MKINCPKCRKPFQLASQKLSGQVVKIRCSSCGTVFKVRGKPRAQAAPAATSPETAAAPGAAPLPKASVAWFAVVGKKRVGPFGEVALKRLVAGGKVLASTRLWRKGLDAWSPAGELEELAGLFPAAQPMAGVDAVPKAAPEAAPAPETPLEPEAAPEPAPRPAAEAPPPSLPPKLPPKPSKPALKVVEDEAEAPPAMPEPTEHTDEGLAGWHEDDSALEQDEDAAAGFFEAGEQADEHHREMEAIDFGEAEIEPITLEEAGVAKGARETLADFSVMAKLSSRDRRRKTGILVLLAILFTLSLSSLLVFADPFKVFEAEKRELTREESDESLSIFAKESASRNQPLVKASRPARGPKQVAGDPLDSEEEWDLLDESDPELKAALLSAGAATGAGIDKETMRESFEKGDRKEPSSSGHRKAPRKDEMTEWGGDTARVAGSDGGSTDLSNLIPKETEAGLRAKGGDAIAITAKSKVVDRVKTEGGGFLGSGSVEEGRVEADVKERKSSGKLWKLRAKTNVMRKVKAQTKKIKTCADMADVDTGVKIFLHVGLDGRVSNISSPKGGGRFTGCLMEIFGDFRVIQRRLEKRIKMPVILHFE